MNETVYQRDTDLYIANYYINEIDFNKNCIANIIQTLKNRYNVIIKEKQNNYVYIIERNNITYTFTPYYLKDNEIYGIYIKAH